MDKKDLELLKSLSTQLEDKDSQNKVIASQVHNPAKEVEGAIASFLTARLDRINEDADFTDLIRMNLRQRMSEASFEELMKLLEVTSSANNEAVNSVLKMFKNETSGKTILDQFKDTTSSNAANLYNSTNDEKVLQAVNYFTQIFSDITNSPKVIETFAEEKN